MKAEFEEKSYELGFNLELGAGQAGRTVFAPGQVVEGAIGFDVAWQLGATNPAWAAIARAARSGFPIRSAVPASLPKSVFNLFIQYKRSEFLHGSRAQHLTHFAGPYHRFKFDDPLGQLQTLQALEARVGEFAHVVYAAPEFHSMSDLMRALTTSQVIAESVIVSPSALLDGHRSYNFKSGYDSRLNPVPEDIQAVPATDFFDNPESFGAVAQDLATALGHIHDAIALSEDWQTDWNELQRALAFTDDDLGPDVEFSRRYLELTAFAWTRGLTWVLLDSQSSESVDVSAS